MPGKVALVLAVFVAGMTFVADWMSPLGVAVPVAYVLVVSLVKFSRRPKWVWLAALFCSLLTLIGWTLSADGYGSAPVVANRFLALATIWLTAILCNRSINYSARAQAQQIRVQAALDAGLTGTWFLNVRDNRIQVDENLARFVSEQPQRVSDDGLTQDEFLTVTHADDRSLVQEKLQNAIAEGKSIDFEFRLIRPNGSINWVSARGHTETNPAGKVTGVRGVVVDIAKLKESEIHAGRIAATFSRLIDQSPFGIYIVDANFRIARVSEGARPAFRSVTPLIGRDFDEVMHILWPESFASEAVAIFRHTLDTGEPYLAPSLTETRVDLGEVESYEWQVHRVTMPDGKYAAVCYYFDSIDIREVELALRESEQRAQLASLAKSEFLANMSHEIRTPLAAIMGHVDILLASLAKNDNRDYAMIIRRNGEHLLEILNDILDLSRIESGTEEITLRSCDTGRMLVDIYSLMSVRVDDDVVDFRIAENCKIPQTIRTDEKRLRQILINLIGNAVKFTRRGHIEIGVMLLNENGSAPAIRFDITDSGIGLAEADLEKILQPFSQVDSSVSRTAGGSGLGLAICQRLVDRLGGKLEVTSILGKGSTFSATIPTGSLDDIPIVDLGVEPATKSEPETLASVVLDCHVLLVDDHRDMRNAVRHILQEAGALVVTAENGEQAIHAVRDAAGEGEAIEIVLMDMHMPLKDGYSAVAQLRSEGYDIPIVALTAAAMPIDRQRCLDAGCSAYLSKPVDQQELTSVVHRLTKHGNRPAAVAVDDDRKDAEEISVLVVDDHVDSAIATAKLLQLNGLQTTVAHTGAEARELISTLNPNAVLMDISLPDMDGNRVAETVRKEGFSGVLVAHSGHSNATAMQQSLDAGFDHYVVKPAKKGEIETLINEACATQRERTNPATGL